MLFVNSSRMLFFSQGWFSDLLRNFYERTRHTTHVQAQYLGLLYINLGLGQSYVYFGKSYPVQLPCFPLIGNYFSRKHEIYPRGKHSILHLLQLSFFSIPPQTTDHVTELPVSGFRFVLVNAFLPLLLCLTSGFCSLSPVREAFQHHFKSTCCSFLLSILKGVYFLTNRSFKEYVQNLGLACSQLPPSAAIPWIERPLSLHNEVHMSRVHFLSTPFPEIARQNPCFLP